MSFTAHHTLRFTSAVKVSDGARAIISRDKARAQRFLAGIQPHGPSAHKLTELRSRVTHHHRAHDHPTHGHQPPIGDTIDVTDAGSFPASFRYQRADINVPAVTYTASVGVGSPATDYTLLIDTGSSNTWVGANTKYNPTRTSKNTGKSVVRTAC